MEIDVTQVLEMLELAGASCALVVAIRLSLDAVIYAYRAVRLFFER